MKIINNIERMNNNIHLDIEEDKERFYIYKGEEFTSVSKKELKKMKDAEIKERLEDEFVLFY